MILRKLIFASAILTSSIVTAPSPAQVVELSENFTSATQATGGWTLTSGFWPAQNNSDNPQPYAANGGAWGPGGTLFNPAPGSGYFATDTTATGNAGGTVSDWLLTPVLTLHNGDILTFATRTRSPEEGPSRLEIRLSVSGTSSSVGMLPGDVGVFTQVVGTINPNLTAGAYPQSWAAGTETFTISGLAGNPTGRIAFQTFYPNGGFAGPNGDTIGLATVKYTSTPQTMWTWTGNTSGSWNTTGNWSPTGVPASNIDNQLTFGATAHATMTNDIAGTLTLNLVTFTSAAPAYTLTGNGLNFQTSSSGAMPQIVTNSANGVTIGSAVTLTNNLTVAGSGALTLNGAIGGAGSLTMFGTGTLVLGNGSNTYAGGTAVLTGTVSVAADAALGTGNVTGAMGGTVAFTGTTSTAKSFALNGGTMTVAAGQTVTVNGGPISGATLGGAGTIATGAGTGTRFVDVTSTPTVALASNSANDEFVHFTNSAALTVAAGLNTTGAGATVNFNGFTNEGAGAITIGAASRLNVSNFQTYGTLTLNPATVGSGQFTLLKNVGTAPLGFNGGSQTFIGTPGTATATPPVAGVDLRGQNLAIADGLFVNNGFVTDSVGGGSIIVDYGGLYKGAGTSFVPIVTQNGGRVQAGNSPGLAQFGHLVIGPGQTNFFQWQINDARGTAGPGGTGGTPVSGWSQFRSQMTFDPGTGTTSDGNLVWTATPSAKFQFALETLFNPTPVGSTNDGKMDNFHNPADNGGSSAPNDTLDGDFAFVWPIITFQGTYSGPTDSATLTADTQFDTTQFQNHLPAGATFSMAFDPVGKAIDLVYTPTSVPEPGTLGLVAVGLLGMWRLRRGLRT